jgi:hypothetical protein
MPPIARAVVAVVLAVRPVQQQATSPPERRVALKTERMIAII